MEILDAGEADLAEVQAIYAHHVLHGTGTFEEAPPSLEEFGARYQAIRQGGHEWLVARDGAACLGFGYYGPFRARPAYRFTVEDSVYVREDMRGRGVGQALLAALLERAQAAGFRQMLALIGNSQNASSIGVHTSLGFGHAGVMRDAGFKQGRWLDVVVMQKALAGK